MFHWLKRVLVGSIVFGAANAIAPVAGPLIAGIVLTPLAVADHNRRRHPAPRVTPPVIGSGTAVGPVRVSRLHQTW